MEKKKIMVIDDERAFLRIVKINLEETGKYDVKVIQYADDMLPLLRVFSPDLILLDILMPGVGGFEACQMLKENPIGKDVPVIIVSAVDEKDAKEQARNLGVLDFLVKPIEFGDLLSSIEKVLGE